MVGGGPDYVTVGYRADDNAVWVDNLISIGNQGDTRYERKLCPNPDATWNRIELILGNGKDTTDPSGDSPEFSAVPAEIEMSIKGGRQIDELYGHNGPDEIVGFEGDDHIDAADGIKDQVLCGQGDDTAVVDSEDRPKDCETVRSRSPSGRR